MNLCTTLARDGAAYGVACWTWRRRLSPRSIDRIMRWQRRLRYLEQMAMHDNNLVSSVWLAAVWRYHARDAAALGFTIPPGVFGPGLVVAHYGTITVNPNARVGSNCRIHPSTTIGAAENGAPVIGDNCYIGPGARILGGIVLGDNVVVGANAVVLKSFPDNVVLAGAPARVIKTDVEYRWRH